MSNQSVPLVSGRLDPIAASLAQHLIGPRLDRELKHLTEHIEVDRAHTVMLCEQGILTQEQAASIVIALREAVALGDAFPVDPEFDSLLLQVERFLEERVGNDSAGRMHTGRSRIDQNAAKARIIARDGLVELYSAVVAFMETLVSLAERHVATVMPGWTHLQHAQPWTLGHYLLRHAFVMHRYARRMEECYSRVNMSSLGGAALAGTSWPLDRVRVAELLGHDDIVVNSHDAGEFTLDWGMELAALYSTLMVDVGRLAGDLYLWHSWEFGLIEVADGFCGTSSIMPQKKNAVALEYIRAEAGNATGWIVAVMGVARSASSTDCDPAYASSVVPQAASVCASSLALMNEVMSTMTVNEERMRERASANWSTASALADGMVERYGIPFRAAHQAVARLVKQCVSDGVSPAAVTAAMVSKATASIAGEPIEPEVEWVVSHLDPTSFIETRVTAGGPQRESVLGQIATMCTHLKDHVEWLGMVRSRIARASEELRRSEERLISQAHGGSWKPK